MKSTGGVVGWDGSGRGGVGPPFGRHVDLWLFHFNSLVLVFQNNNV